MAMMRFSMAVLVLVSAAALVHTNARNLPTDDTANNIQNTPLPQSQVLPLDATAPKAEPPTALADRKNFFYGAGIGGAAGMGGYLGIPGSLPFPAGGSPLLGGLGGGGGLGGSGGISGGVPSSGANLPFP